MFSFDRVIFQLKTNYNILVIPDLKNKQTDQKKKTKPTHSVPIVQEVWGCQLFYCSHSQILNCCTWLQNGISK